MTFALIIPSLNAGAHWPALIKGLQMQTAKPEQVIILDSESTDNTATLARDAGFRVVTIPRKEFNHGGTRQLGADLVPAVDIVVYTTQDAVLAEADSVARLLSAFQSPTVGAAYGRQLPRPEANAIEAFARMFNYPNNSAVRSFEDRLQIGIRATFLSNSFSAYRQTALQAVGGFPTNTIVAEDALTAGKMLKAGWETAYVAEATAVHSHNYSAMEEFRRYFDTGVYHSREAWLRDEFGSANSEGMHFVRSELRYLRQHDPLLIPSAIVRTFYKAAGYYLGRREAKLPLWLRKKFSMHKAYWK